MLKVSMILKGIDILIDHIEILLKTILGFILSLLTILFIQIYYSNKTTLQITEEFIQKLIKYLNEIENRIKQQKPKENEFQLEINEKEIKKEEEKCREHRYQIRIIERSPLIIYIENFLHKDEIDHLIELG